MMYAKMLGLLAVAAAALMAFVGTASAATATSSAGTLYTSTIKASSSNATLHNAVGTIECASTVEGKIESHVAGKISKLTFGNSNGECVDGSVHHETFKGPSIKGGELSVASNGTVTSSGATVMVTMFGVECGYTTGEGVTIGTLTDAPSNTGHAVLDIKASLPRTEGSGSFFCANTGEWTGQYKVTTPTGLYID